MAINLYVTSTQNFSGKSAVCVALMDRLKKDGYTVGYLKPFSSAARVMAESSVDEDARFIKETFDLKESLETLAPVVLTNQQMRAILAQGGADYSQKVKQAGQTVGQGKDIVVLEGSANFREGYIVNLAPPQTVDLLDAKVITVVGYQDSLQVVDDILTAEARMGQRLVGVIVNTVPANRTDYVNNQVKPFMQKQGVKVLAVLQREQVLQSISVGDIVEALSGELLSGEYATSLVENFLVASMSVEHALNYFRRVVNKAVIVGGDRPDVQLAALETSTRALILTGNMRPNPMIAARAEERHVAIVVSPHDTLTTVELVGQFFGKSRFHQVEKVTRFEEILQKELDFAALYQTLGLKK
jgi:BioD-like phosphotransacetylase family protein